MAVFGEVGVELRLELGEGAEFLGVERVEGLVQALVFTGNSGERLKGAVAVGGPSGADDQVGDKAERPSRRALKQQPGKRKTGAGEGSRSAGRRSA